MESEEHDFEEVYVKAGGKEKGSEKCEWLETEDVQESPAEYLPAGLSDPVGLGDGICDTFDAWDEKKEDYVTVRERSLQNICVKVCEDKQVPGGKYKKDKIRGRHIARKSEGIDATIKAKNTIINALEDLKNMNALKDTPASVNSLAATLPQCERADKQVQIDAWIAKQVLVPVLLGVKIASRITETLAQTMDPACKQVIAGFSSSLACTPAVIADQIAKALVDGVEFGIAQTDLIIEFHDYRSVNETFECADKIRKTQAEMLGLVTGMDAIVRDINKKAGDAAAGITELKGLVMENREYIKDNRKLALTPHGRRDNLPLYEAPPPPPKIVSVVGQNTTLTVTFNEGVTGTGQSGELTEEDFILTDNAPSNQEIITAVTHVAGSLTASLILDNPLDGDESAVDTLAAVAHAIFNQFDIPMDDSIEYYIE